MNQEQLLLKRFVPQGKISKNSESIIGYEHYGVLHKFGLSPSVLPASFRGMDLVSCNRHYKVIACRNINGGFECFNEYVGLFTLDKDGITVNNVYQSRRSKECCLFTNILDYMSYLTLCSIKSVSLPRYCDCIILNTEKNYNAFNLECDHYQFIHCFFPKYVSGMTLEKTLFTEFKGRIDSYTKQYDNNSSLLEYVSNFNKITL